MLWVFAIVGLLLIVGIGLVIIGRETNRLAARPRPSVFDVNEAVEFVANRLSPDAQARLSLDDVHWILMTDADLVEDATRDLTEGPYPWSRPRGAGETGETNGKEVAEPGDDAAAEPSDFDTAHTIDEDVAVARILVAAESQELDLTDDDIAEVLMRRNEYLLAIGAVGEEIADDPGAMSD